MTARRGNVPALQIGTGGGEVSIQAGIRYRHIPPQSDAICFLLTLQTFEARRNSTRAGIESRLLLPHLVYFFRSRPSVLRSIPRRLGHHIRLGVRVILGPGRVWSFFQLAGRGRRVIGWFGWDL